MKSQKTLRRSQEPLEITLSFLSGKEDSYPILTNSPLTGSGT